MTKLGSSSVRLRCGGCERVYAGLWTVVNGARCGLVVT